MSGKCRRKWPSPFRCNLCTAICQTWQEWGMSQRKPTFLSFPLWQLIFYLGISPLSLLYWPMSHSCVHAIPPYLQWFWMLWRQKSLLWLSCSIPVLAAFPRQFHPVSAQGFYVVSLLAASDWFFSPSRMWGCWRSLQSSQPSCTLLKVRNPPPSLPFPHCFTEYFLVYINACVCSPCCLSLAWFDSLSLQCKHEKGKWYRGCCFLTW